MSPCSPFSVLKLVCKEIPHAIPRFIAGIIVGNPLKYKRKLDRQMRMLRHHSPTKGRGGTKRAFGCPLWPNMIT